MPPILRQRSRRNPSVSTTTQRDPSQEELKRYRRNLRWHIRQGRMVTFDHNRRQWKHWPRPYIEHEDGTMSNFLPSYRFAAANPPPVLCPHVLSPNLTTADCTMVVHISPVDAGDYFAINNMSHPCDFRIPIPTLTDLPQEIDDWPPLDQPTFPTFEDEEDEDSLELVITNDLSSSLPSPRPRRLPQDVKPGFQAFFVRERALLRAEYNPKFIEKIGVGHSTGEYMKCGLPSHPVHSISTHDLLREWDLDVNPNGQNLANQHQHFVGTGVGMATRNLFSTRGIPNEVWNTVVASAITCSVCCCVYSADGYNDHIDGHGYCRNWFEPVCSSTPIRCDTSVAPESMWAPGLPGDGEEDWWDKQSASCAALLQWNSRIGISQDVWAVISTMEVFCPDCSRVRSTEGHHRHLGGRC
ncbi:hypothetical protein PM082_021900 [Marasmius tenuissimus]|nr:hypothetical protein PM082_021900 [Marasmius tenuissimus]